jgi:diguanylate cyclase (GGDEF)-like protein/putative nucleotidyltransferase with HDIG domain/PAS domain S-box-containing protein
MTNCDEIHAADDESAKVKYIFFNRFVRVDVHSAWIQSLKIAIIYLFVGALWILMSDKVVLALFKDPETIVLVSLIKGWAYVLVTAAFIFWLAYREIVRAMNCRKDTYELFLQLQRSNKLFSAILESSPEIMIYSVDNTYCYSSFNQLHKKSMMRLWGQDISIGMNILDTIVLEDESEKAKVAYDRALSGEYFMQIEDYLDEKDSRVFWQSYYSPIFDDEKVVSGFTCFALDISSLKRAQEQNQYLRYHDNLTGLYNRRYYENSLRRVDRESNLPISIILGDVNGLKLINDAFGHHVGDELLKRAAEAMSSACRSSDIAARWGGDEFIVLLPKTDHEQAEEVVNKMKLLCTHMKVESVTVDISFGFATKIQSSDDMQNCIKSAEDTMFKNKVIESKSMRSHTIKTIMNTLHEKNPREENHSKRVGEICRKIATAMKYTDTEIKTLTLVGFLHDIGKIAIGEEILNKPGKLTEEEFEVIKQHPEIGCRIIRSSYEISEVAEAVLSHHENWDGTGYPKGLSGEMIPKFARVIAIADSFDAMTSERTYRETWTSEQAAAEILRCSGTRYDPTIAKVFVEEVLHYPSDLLPWK